MGSASKSSSQSQSGMGGGAQGQAGMGGGGQGQAAAANGVQAKAGSSPSMGQMQEGMGGLLGIPGMIDSFQGFISPMVDSVRNFQNETTQQMLNQFDLNPGKTAFEKANNIEPTSQGEAFAETVAEQNAAREPDAGELSPYEKRIRELMTTNGMSRGEAEANQAHAQKLKTDNNEDGAVTNKEWALNQGADFDGDGDVTHAEWTKHQAAGAAGNAGAKGKKKDEEEEEDFGLQQRKGPRYDTQAHRASRAAKMARLGG
jgi:hypothetical protein